MVGGEQQSFLDARVSPEPHGDEYELSILEAPEPRAADEGTELPFINWEEDNENLPPIPEGDECDNVGALRRGISDASKDMSEETDATEEFVEAASSSHDRRTSSAAPRADRRTSDLLPRLSLRASEDHS